MFSIEFIFDVMNLWRGLWTPFPSSHCTSASPLHDHPHLTLILVNEHPCVYSPYLHLTLGLALFCLMLLHDALSSPWSWFMFVSLFMYA